MMIERGIPLLLEKQPASRSHDVRSRTSVSVIGPRAPVSHAGLSRIYGLHGLLRWSMAALVVFVALSSVTRSQAQVVIDLVGNYNQGSTGESFYNDILAQRFTTGSHSGGYVLDHIEFRRMSSFPPGVEVCATDDDGFPTSPCTSLSLRRAPVYRDTTVIYDAPDSTRLSNNTEYTVYINNLFNRTFRWTTSDAEDISSARGWNIANELDYVERVSDRNGGGGIEKPTVDEWNTATNGRSLRLVIRGHRQMPAPCNAPSLTYRTEIWKNDIVIGADGSAYGYSSAELNVPSAAEYGKLTMPAADSFTDAQEDSTYTIGAVRVLGIGSLQVYLSDALPDTVASTVSFHACDAAFMFSEADDETAYQDWYRYTWYNSGLNWSSDIVRTVRISSRNPNYPAAGKPTISGRGRVGETLTIRTDDISDVNGLPETFSYQWIRVEGRSESEIQGAVDSTYTVLGPDHGKAIRVKVSFVDKDGYDESLTSDTAPSGGLIGGVPPASARADPQNPGSAIEVTWSAVEQVGASVVDGYRVEVRSDRTGWTTLVADTENTTDLVYIHSGLPPGSQRYYRVYPLSGSEDFGYGPEASGRTHPNPPGVPRVRVTRLPGSKWPPPGTGNSPLSLSILGFYQLSWDQVDDGAPEYAANVNYCIIGWPLGYSEVAQRSTSGDGTTNHARVYVDPAAVNQLRVRAYNYANRPDAGNELCTSGSINITQISRNTARVTKTPQVSGAGSDGTWNEGERVEVTLTFSETVTVDTSGGTPSLRVSLGQVGDRSARYLRGSGSSKVVFAYRLGTWDGTHGSLKVRSNSLVLNGGSIRGGATQKKARLEHAGITVSTASAPAGRPTARFESLPSKHDGSTAFTFELHFSKEPQGLSYRTVGGSLLEVSGADVTAARRLTAGSNIGWEVTVAPNQNGDIVIRLPNRACGTANAICIDGQPLAASVSATVPGVQRATPPSSPPPPSPPPEPFTGSFGAGTPAEHAASKFEIEFHLSHNPDGLSYVTVRDDLFTVSGGSIENAWRKTRGAEKDMHWGIRIVPDGLGDVVVTLIPTTDCDTSPGVCRGSDEAMLDNQRSVRIKGPATISVADATVEEANGAMLDFVVTLSRQRAKTTTVAFATSNGTATGGADYTPTSGTLTFGSLETMKKISVPVLDDNHDEGAENMTLTLSDPSPAAYVRILDTEATGTITNADPMPKAWLVRFGRTTADHALAAIGRRMDTVEAGARAESHLTIGGRSMNTFLDPLHVLHPGSAGVRTTDRGSANGIPDGVPPLPETASRGDASSNRMRLPELRDLVLGSSFYFSPGSDEAPGLPEVSEPEMVGPEVSEPEMSGPLADWAVWGGAALTGFNGTDGAMSLKGDVTTATVGIDTRWNRWLAGLALSYSDGDGAYTHPEGIGGAVTSTLANVAPYARFRIGTRASVWGALGYGSGELTLTPDMPDTSSSGTGAALGHGTCIANRMAAIGGRAEITSRTGAAAEVRLEVVSDVRMTRTSSKAASNLASIDAGTVRARALLKSSGKVRFGGQALLPTLVAGLRYDDGDAETGTGLEVGAGLGYGIGRVTMKLDGRALLVHEDDDYEEWGLSGQLIYAPNTNGRGLTISLGSANGATRSAIRRLWSSQTTAELARGGSTMRFGQNYQSEIGYILTDAWRFALWTPYIGSGAVENGNRWLHMGVRINSDARFVANLDIRRQTGAAGYAEDTLAINATFRF